MIFATTLAGSLCSRGAENTLTCQAILRTERAGGDETLVAEGPDAPSDPKRVAFLAVVSSSWPPGLVPLFAIEKNGHFELRRRPLRGQEHLTEPLFFAAPLEEERESAKIAGRWEGVATHLDGGKKYPAFELTTDAGAIVGRFDPGSDYRYAFVTGGVFRTNQIEIQIEYIQDRYTLTGIWSGGQLRGTWQQLEGTLRGSWEAERSQPKIKFVPPSLLKPLYEWHRAADGARRYSVALVLDEPGWERTPRPLCLVWVK